MSHVNCCINLQAKLQAEDMQQQADGLSSNLEAASAQQEALQQGLEAAQRLEAEQQQAWKEAGHQLQQQAAAAAAKLAEAESKLQGLQILAARTEEQRQQEIAEEAQRYSKMEELLARERADTAEVIARNPWCHAQPEGPACYLCLHVTLLLGS